MDYEKKYKDALERAKKWYYAPNADKIPTYANRVIEEIFPELKESEDEKIKETLIDYFKTYKEQEECGIKTFFGIPTDNIIAWLEKQGEKKVPINDFKAKDWYVSKVDGNIHDMTYNAADKVESKFHKDNWIVNNITKDVFLIKSINNGYCTLEDIEGNIISPCLPFESEFHLWTIDDAKDGDVLVYGDNPNDHHVKVIMIFKSWRNSESAFTYFHVYDNEVRVNDWCDCGKNAHPATKEQRDILFTKMKKAGYELDVEKKVIIPISKSKVVEYVYILDYCSGRVIVAKHDIKESFEDFFKKLGLKENQCHYMTSSNILSIEYINF